MRILLITALLFCAVSIGIRAQERDSVLVKSPPEYGLMPKVEPTGLRSLQVSGYYRFYATYQRQLDPYLLNPIIGDTALPRNIFIGDDSQLPNLLLNVSARTSEKTFWSFDLMMFQFLNGNIGTAYTGQVADSLRPDIQRPLLGTRLGSNLGMLLGMNMSGNFDTEVGNINVTVGGIQWYAMSDLTMASFKGYNRFLLFERNPWDPMGMGMSDRYNQFFEEGSITQDTRWGNRAFHGIVLKGSNMPGKTSFDILLGKTELNGGFALSPNMSYGGKIKKDFGKGKFVSINSLNSSSSTDSLSLDTYGFHMLTAEFAWMVSGYSIKGELGGGNYFSPTNTGDWGEALQLKFATPATGHKLQGELHYYRISADVVNNNALFWNTATSEYRVNDIPAGSVGSTAVLQPFSSAMVRLGQMTNNREGLNLNLQANLKKFRFSGGLGFATELEPSAAVITFGHPVNNFTRSRFWRWIFPAGVGPYSRYSDIFRDTYDTVELLDDSSGTVIHAKHFNMMEAQVKYRTKLFGKDFFIFSLLQANSSSRKWSPVTITNEDAYIRQYIAEFELYYALRPGWLINGYYGFERTLGNYWTDIDEITGRPRNQTGEGIGCGLDIDMGKNVRFYVRHRWYYFRDQSFELDRFRGRELTLEMKAFF
ncbi:MAG: hypothetical protein RL220_1198 [Bacteroidota bacterium]